MSSLKIIIPILLVLILAAAGVYSIYKTQTADTPITAIASASPIATGFPTQSPSSKPAIAQNQNTANAQNQPATGPEDGLEIKNEGIQINSPAQSTAISSPAKITGKANVTSQKVTILVLDTNGNLLGQGQASACVGLDACPFEASITFTKPTTTTGKIVLYAPSQIDNSPTYATSIPVTF